MCTKIPQFRRSISFSCRKNPADVQYLINLSQDHDYYSIYLQLASIPNTESLVMTDIKDKFVFRKNSGSVDFTAILSEAFYSWPQSETNEGCALNTHPLLIPRK